MSADIVAIIDYGSGNLHSAAKAFERAAREAGTESRIVVTSDPAVVAAADRVVLPGVGAYADCRRGLDAVSGMVEAMTEAAHGRGRPFLGICVGMQLLASRGLEYEVTPGLGWIPGDVAPITPSDPGLKVPHMGWNTLEGAAATRCSTASRRAGRGCTPISCTATRSRPPSPATWSPPPITAGRSPPWWPAAPSPAPSSTPRRARPSGSG